MMRNEATYPLAVFLPILAPPPACRDLLTAAYFQADTLLQTQNQGSSMLVVDCDVPEEVSHGLAIMDSPNCLRKNQADVHGLYLGAL